MSTIYYLILTTILFNYDMINCHWCHSNFAISMKCFPLHAKVVRSIYTISQKKNKRSANLCVAVTETQFNYHYDFFYYKFHKSMQISATWTKYKKIKEIFKKF